MVCLPVVHSHRLTRPEKCEIDPELLEVRVALAGPLEVAQHSTATALPPLRLPCVENKPAVALWRKATLGLDKLSGSHAHRAWHVRRETAALGCASVPE